VAGTPDYQCRVEHVDEIGIVRRQLARLLAPLGDEDLSFRAVIALDELLANCLVHTDEGDCTITAWLDHGPPPTLRVEVQDAGDEQTVMPTSRGLRVVDRVTSRWGLETRPAARVVWFEIALPSPVEGWEDRGG